MTQRCMRCLRCCHEEVEPYETVGQDSDSDTEEEHYKAIFPTVLPQPVPEHQYLNEDDRKPIEIGKTHEQTVDKVFNNIVNPFNSILENLQWLRRERESILKHCEVWPESLDSALRYIRTFGLTITLERNENRNLVIDMTSNEDLPFHIQECWKSIEMMVDLINALEEVEQFDPCNTVRYLRGHSSMVIRVKEQHAGKEGFTGTQSLQNCHAGLKALETVPCRWKMMLQEKNDLVKEFLIATQHLMDSPMDVTSVREQQLQPTF